MVSQKDLDMGSLYPPLEDIQHCSNVIAAAVAEHAYKTGKKTHADARLGGRELGLGIV